MLEREGTRLAENVAESMLIYASSAYLIVVALAFGLWLFSRLEHPKGSATTERGKRLHALAGERLREHRNLLILTLLPLLIIMLLPGLPVIHPAATVASLLILVLIAGLVVRGTMRFVSRNA